MRYDPNGPRLLVSELLEGYDDIFRTWKDLDRNPLTEAEIRDYSGDLDTYKGGFKVRTLGHGTHETRLDHIKRVRYCMAHLDAMDPVLIHQTTDDSVLLWDGHHRLLAALLLGRDSVLIRWRGNWEHLIEAFPKSAEAGLLATRTNEVYWPGLASYEKRRVEREERLARRRANKGFV